MPRSAVCGGKSPPPTRTLTIGRASCLSGRATPSRGTPVAGRTPLTVRSSLSSRPHSSWRTLRASETPGARRSGRSGRPFNTLLSLIATRTTRSRISLQTLGTSISSLANRSTGSLPAHGTQQSGHTLDSLVASRAPWSDRARRARRSNLHDDFGVLRLHALLPLGEGGDLGVESRLLGPELLELSDLIGGEVRAELQAISLLNQLHPVPI
mmetsp:Transcript_9916/g.15505  ORF Transcript_9916/g.15505 Transcript_9916/m.15505 type:complete len:211 (+) Transcript_9916:129-761(+)